MEISHEWLIEDWFPIGHKVMDTSTEGSFKTMTGCYISVCIAAGIPVFGKHVKQGPVLIVDEETPEADLYIHLHRFALSFGYSDWSELPIIVLPMTGFRFNRKTELDRLLKIITKVKPIFIRIDSVLACLPAGRQGMEENSDKSGIYMREDLNKILSRNPECTFLIAAHSKKEVAKLGFNEKKASEMVSLVRGHGSIVGEACDTGLVIHKLSEHPNPTRFVIITKPRRKAIPMVEKDLYIELEEEGYGKGKANLKEISPIIIPPSKIARDLFPIFSSETIEARDILRRAALYSKPEIKTGIEELQDRQVIIENEAFSYKLNPNLEAIVDEDYLNLLEMSNQRN